MKRNRILVLLVSAVILLAGCTAGDSNDKNTDSTNSKEVIENMENTVRKQINLNGNWKYYQGEVDGIFEENYDDSDWTYVNLPHNTTNYTEDSKDAYEGISCYRKEFSVDKALEGKHFALNFEGVMQRCTVYLNGEEIAQHFNGYTPFSIDITDKLIIGNKNIIAVITDSSPHPEYTPGKVKPDFQYFGGIYRNVTLDVTECIYIGDAVLDNATAGGGVFLTSPSVSKESADVRAKTYIHNDSDATKDITLVTEIIYDDTTVAEKTTTQEIVAGGAYTFDELLTVANPHLWHPYTPDLYTVKLTVKADDKIVDEFETSYGIRSVEWTHEGLYINGERFKAQGANLHSDIFVLGDAIPDNEIFEEIKRLKENGFDFIRMSHYPHSDAYYEACDKYGVLVLDCMSGWQNFNNSDTFKNSTYEELRTMIRNSRNHPCIIAWETSLNESNFNGRWAKEVQSIAHEEYPTEGISRMWTAGWKTSLFDIHLGAAQHDIKNTGDDTDKGVIISEYGDWDYGGTESTSRRDRTDGDMGMLLQASNHIESAILNLNKSWFCVDGLWSYNDYAGFDSEITNCGVADIYRLNKYSAYFFRSQRDADVDMSKYGINSGAMVFIANSLSDASPKDVTIFSNCDEVELFVDGVSIGKQAPDTEYYGNNSQAMLSTESLPHPPITFKNANINVKELKAVGYINGNQVCEYNVKAPQKAVAIELVAESDTPIVANNSDVKLVWVKLVDENGTVTANANKLVSFEVENGYVLGYENVNTRAGQIGVWVRANASESDCTVILTASADGVSDGSLEISCMGCDYASDCDKASNEYAGASEKPNVEKTLSDKAREKPSYSSSGFAEYGNNGEPSTFWYPDDNDTNVWWYVDTGDVYDFERIEISWEKSVAHKYKIEISNDSENWTTVLDMSENNKEEIQTAENISASGRYIRLAFAENESYGFNMFYAYGK